MTLQTVSVLSVGCLSSLQSKCLKGNTDYLFLQTSSSSCFLNFLQSSLGDRQAWNYVDCFHSNICTLDTLDICCNCPLKILPRLFQSSLPGVLARVRSAHQRPLCFSSLLSSNTFNVCPGFPWAAGICSQSSYSCPPAGPIVITSTTSCHDLCDCLISPIKLQSALMQGPHLGCLKFPRTCINCLISIYCINRCFP